MCQRWCSSALWWWAGWQLKTQAHTNLTPFLSFMLLLFVLRHFLVLWDSGLCAALLKRHLASTGESDNNTLCNRSETKNPKQLLFSRPKSAHFLFCSRIAFFSFNSFIAACFLSSGLFQGGESKRGSWGIMPALVAVFFLKNKFKQTASYLWLVWALGSQLRFLSPGFLHRQWY